MKEVIRAMLEKYGPEDILTDIARGFSEAAEHIYVKTEHSELLKKVLYECATKIFQLRNEVRKQII